MATNKKTTVKTTMTQDEIVKQLFAEVQQKKMNLAQSSKENCWKTSRLFRFSLDSAHGGTDIATVTDVRKLKEILSFLIDREAKDGEAAMRLGLAMTEFKWLNFTVAEWENDLVLRVTQILRKEKQRELETLETRLNAVLSPELKTQMEIEEIQALLGK